MYLVIRSLKSGNDKIDYKIKQGDILKIGRVKFQVKAINIESNQGAVEEIGIEDQEYKELKAIFTDES